MDLTRRQYLGAAGSVAGIVAVGGCNGLIAQGIKAQPPTESSLPDREATPNARRLNRLGFGPSQDDVSKLDSLGWEAYFKSQLKPVRLNLQTSPALAIRLRHLDVLEAEAAELRDQPTDEVLRQLQQASLLRATYSPNQLLERMVDFWANHFNIYGRKFLSAYRIPADQAQVIQTHALGSFPEMLRASAHSTAMLLYLDNQLNTQGVPNENYARELMELHSLGVHGGYTQRDVREVARCFTGWTMETRLLRPRGRFRFDSDLHDDGEKTVLGHKIGAGGGQADGDRVLEILSSHPATAHHIAGKLCRHFLGDENKGRADVEQAFLRTGGNVAEMLDVIFAHEALLSGPPIVKRPFDFIVSSLRAVNASTNGGKPLQDYLDQMGQPLFQWPMPDGYPDKTSAWTGSLLGRWNFALALCADAIPGTRVALTDHEEVAVRLCQPSFQWR